MVLSVSLFFSIIYKASICYAISSIVEYQMVLLLLASMGTVKSDDLELTLWNEIVFFLLILLLYDMDSLRGGKSSILIKNFMQFYFFHFGNILCNTFVHEMIVVWSGLAYSLCMMVVFINSR